MTAKEFRGIAKVMKDFGITHFKSSEFEVFMGMPVIAESAVEIESEAPKKRRGRPRKEEISEAPPIPHVVTELTSVMKLSDEDLVNKLFPDTQEEEIA